MKIERIFEKNDNLASIINTIIDKKLDNEFNILLSKNSIKTNIDLYCHSDYNDIKIDCVAQKKGGIQ